MASRQREIISVFSLIVILSGLFISLSLVKKNQQIKIPAQTIELIILPTKDATTSSQNPNQNFGSSAKLEVDGQPAKNIWVTFAIDASTIQGTIVDAKLKLYSTNPSPYGGDLYYTSKDTWAESTITWSNQPAIDNRLLTGMGAVTAGNNYYWDVTSIMNSNEGHYTFALVSDNPDGADYSSRESTSNKPQLIIKILNDTNEDKNTLLDLIGDVTKAEGYKYGLKDNLGHTLDTLKIIEDPNGGYLGVSHYLKDNIFTLELTKSSDLLNWQHITDIETNSSHPSIYSLPNGGFIIVFEKLENPLPHRVYARYYKDFSSLISNLYESEIKLPATLSTIAEGTPNIFSVKFMGVEGDIANSIIDIGHHYFKDGIVDQVARGSLKNFSLWKTFPQNSINTSVQNLGVTGNIGDRDTLIFKGKEYLFQEGQTTKNDWASWKVYLFDIFRQQTNPLTIKTHRGSVSFGNPTTTYLTLPNGNKGYVFTLFLFGEGAATGEGGPLIYYKTYPQVPTSPRWGKIANQNHDNETVKGVFFLAGPPDSNSFIYYTRHPLNASKYNWDTEENIDFQFNEMKNANINTIKLSWWGHRNYISNPPGWWNTIDDNKKVFSEAGDRQILVAPMLEISSNFKFYDEFPIDTSNLEFRIKDLLATYGSFANWLSIYDKYGVPKKVIWLLETIHLGEVNPGEFAQAFDRVAKKIETETGHRIGFIIDPTPLPPNGSYNGPEPIPLKSVNSILAINPFNITSDGNTENERLTIAENILKKWKNSQIPLMVPVLPGYDDHIVRPPGQIYGDNPQWRSGVENLANSYQTTGITLDIWNGFTEGYSFVPTEETADINYKLAQRLFGASISTPTSVVTPTPTNSLKPGDANSDGRVDGLDYVIWLNNYGRTSAGGPGIGDFNRDGRVDGLDYVVWLTNFNS